MRRVLVIKTGTTLPELRPRRGDYEDWIVERLGLPWERIELVVVYEGETLPDPHEPAGVVVTGSSALVSAREPWSERAAAWLREVVATGTPLLGICYGHQLLAHALGGRVGRNPRGREIGTVALELHAAAREDPLLGGLPAQLKVQATHVESVLELPPGARLLASSATDPHQAFACGERAWGVQFHPEFDAEVVRTYLEVRREEIRGEGIDPESLERAVEESPHGTRLLRRFAELLHD
ncbi:MAG: glutamine amidotransferase [Deltaproteobacteria bacterium]|nr:glutamine amidotransferase [Deltaproteobacteria bacterium]